MKNLVLISALLTAMPAFAAEDASDAGFAAELARVRESVIAKRKASRGVFKKFIPGSSKLKLKKNLIVETNLGVSISRMLVSSEFEPGSVALARQEREASQGYSRGSRYIGFALKAQDLGSGRTGFAAGKYENKSQGYIYGRTLAWGRETYGGPGIVAFEFLGMNPNAAFMQDNGTREFPVDPKNPNGPKEERRIAPTFYDEGMRESMVVEAAYDELQKLLAGKLEAVPGTVRYYIRGGFHREVYDLRPIAPVTRHYMHWPLSLRIADQYWKYREANTDKLYPPPGDPEVRRELERMEALKDLLARIEEKEEAGQVLIKVDRSKSDDAAYVLMLEFQKATR